MEVVKGLLIFFGLLASWYVGAHLYDWMDKLKTYRVRTTDTHFIIEPKPVPRAEISEPAIYSKPPKPPKKVEFDYTWEMLDAFEALIDAQEARIKTHKKELESANQFADNLKYINAHDHFGCTICNDRDYIEAVNGFKYYID